MEAFLLSTGIIFIAELGDKSQLMAMTFAARYRAVTILLAITAATATVHLVSVLLGAALGVALPTHTLSVLAGCAAVFECETASQASSCADHAADELMSAPISVPISGRGPMAMPQPDESAETMMWLQLRRGVHERVR